MYSFKITMATVKIPIKIKIKRMHLQSREEPQTPQINQGHLQNQEKESLN
jgi:hypothetical protein